MVIIHWIESAKVKYCSLIVVLTFIPLPVTYNILTSYFSDHPSVEAQSPFQPTEEKSRKKKTKSRHKSGGSDQPLMNSNSSSATVTSEIRTVVHHGYQESQI